MNKKALSISMNLANLTLIIDKQIKEEWLILPGITLAFIRSHMLRKESSGGFTTIEEEGKFSDTESGG